MRRDTRSAPIAPRPERTSPSVLFSLGQQLCARFICTIGLVVTNLLEQHPQHTPRFAQLGILSSFSLELILLSSPSSSSCFGSHLTFVASERASQASQISGDICVTGKYAKPTTLRVFSLLPHILSGYSFLDGPQAHNVGYATLILPSSVKSQAR